MNVDIRVREHIVRKQEHEGSSNEELQKEEERKLGRHIVGTKSAVETRRAGSYYGPHVLARYVSNINARMISTTNQ